ncbi:MAG TPA: hypothetical protein V6C81_15435 [Planktothrix sp.]
MADWTSEFQNTGSAPQVRAEWNVDLSRERVAAKPQSDSAEPAIGQAHIAQDGSLVMQLHSGGPAMIDTTLKYAQSNPVFHRMMSHLGGIKQGDVKSVAPFHDNSSIIGKVKLNTDNTIDVTVNACKSDNFPGERLSYKPSDSYYSVLVSHVDKLQPGQVTDLRAWTDK